ncbi:hypothetical protein NXV07_06330 [Bacteroides fragilis]|nr:hypothetical protein [Bacteroides fragilis]
MKPLFVIQSKEDQGWQQALKEEARSFNRDFYKTLLPIPQDEIDANPSIERSAEYRILIVGKYNLIAL